MMDKNIIVVSLNIVLFAAIVYLVYFLVRICFKENGKLKELLASIDDKYKNRVLNKKADYIFSKNKKTFLKKIDSLIYSSNIRKHFRYLNSEMFLILLLIISTAFSIIVSRIYKSVIFSAVAFAIPPIFSYAALKEMARINFDRIDNNIMNFIISLKSSSKIENNIIFMMDEATKSLKEPLKTYNSEFVREVKRGIPMENAFENYIDKVENIRLKNILKNLYICSINNANYSKLLDKTRIVISKYYEQKEKRKKKVTSGQIGITGIMLVSLLIIHGLTGITPNFYDYMTGSVIGQLIIGYIVCVIIFAVYKCITLKKFNY